MRTTALVLAAAGLALAGCGQKSSSSGGDQAAAPAAAAGKGVWAAGSSTVFPFASRVAENFSRKNPNFATPRMESLGTGGGIKLFCSGASGTPDIANASRHMKASEFDDCQKNGVTEIVELQIGFDGIVIANAKSGGDYDFKPADLYYAFAKQTPGSGGFVANTRKTWADVRQGLPSERILAYGPPPTSGTRDAFDELAMEKGGEAVPEVKALKASDSDKFKAVTHGLREDGAWVDAGENDNAIVQTLTRTPGSMGVFGFSYLEQNADTIKGAKINGVAPTVATIADGSYPLSRSLYLYVNKARIGVTPGLREFLTEFLSDSAAGRGGYLQDRGLVPLPADRHEGQKGALQALQPMARPAS
jgi:phosphate transport system substrate-binding protein